MRKNRITSWILTLALLIGGIPIEMDTSYAAKPATPTNGSFFTVSGSTITGYTGTDAVILIPQTIGGTTITSIGSSAFNSKTVLTEVYIPDGITSIGMDAFYGCSNLVIIELPSTLTTIGKSAFFNCTKLSQINSAVIGQAILPVSIADIGYNAFASCQKIVDITIPEGISYLNAFSGCIGLKRINSAVDGVANIPNSVVSIGSASETAAFRYCTGLVEINLPNGITSLPPYTFQGCSSLIRINSTVDGEINIPSTITEIGNGAFTDCQNIKRVTIPSSVSVLGYSVFYGCKNLLRLNSDTDGVVNFPSWIATIPNETFRGCTGIAEINIPATVTGLGSGVFYGNTALKRMNSTVDGEINIPSTVTSLGPELFYGCSKITKVNIPATITNWMQTRMFYNCAALLEINAGTTHIPAVGSNVFHFCTNLSRINSTVDGEINLPGGITSIGTYMFTRAKKIIKVNVPNGVTTIGLQAFQDSTLEEINLPGSVITINGNAFYATPLKRLNSSKDGTIILGANVKTLGAYVFNTCANIKEIYLNYPSAMSIGSGNISGCWNLEAVYSYGNTLTDTTINTVIKLINSTGETVQATLTDDATAKNYSFGDYTQIQVRTKTTTYSWILEPAAILAKTSGMIEGNTTTYNILAEPIAVIGIAITQNPKTSYIIGDSFDPTGMVVERLWNNGTSDPITDYTIGDYPDPLPVGATMIPISWEEYTIELEVVASDKPADVSATVTLSTYFIADANTGIFVAPDIEIENTCSGLIRISAVGVEDISGPEVVLPGTKDWERLGQSESESYIALGLTGSGVDVWLLPAMEPEPLLDIAPGDMEKLSLQGMFGKAWASGTPLKYRIQFKFDLVD
jgi:hypothetical protein